MLWTDGIVRAEHGKLWCIHENDQRLYHEDVGQREMLLENANELHKTAIVVRESENLEDGVAAATAATPGPRFSASPTNVSGKRSPSSSISESGVDVF